MPRRILVADDMEINRNHLSKILHSDGFEVETVAGGLSAWNELHAQKYHLLITDLRMPELSGLELLAKVRAEKMPVGVIVLTAFGDPSEALRAMKAGADDYVTKPYRARTSPLPGQADVERGELIDELERLEGSSASDHRFHTWSPRVRRLRKVFDLIKQVGPLGSTV